MVDPLSIDVLMAWGSDYLRQIEERLARPSNDPFHVPLEVLKQYLARGNEGLALLKQRTEGARKPGGRPPGSGIGAHAAALIAAGAKEEDAIRAVADHSGKPPENVRELLRRHGRRKPV